MIERQTVPATQVVRGMLAMLPPGTKFTADDLRAFFRTQEGEQPALASLLKVVRTKASGDRVDGVDDVLDTLGDLVTYRHQFSSTFEVMPGGGAKVMDRLHAEAALPDWGALMHVLCKRFQHALPTRPASASEAPPSGDVPSVRAAVQGSSF